MTTDQIMSAVFLIAVLVLVLPGFLSTNDKIKQFMKNLSIWAIIILIIIVFLLDLNMTKINLAITDLRAGWVSN